ncbi:hypothetical protein BHE74_00047739 [Ensete ventricosum]|nr:hypothetical protein BHE74_00047739 [Ensete ventricosum]
MCSRLSLAYRLPHDLSPRRRCRARLPHCNIALSSTVCYSRRHCPTANDQSDHSPTTCLCLHRQRNIATQAEGHARTRRLGGRRRTETAASSAIRSTRGELEIPADNLGSKDSSRIIRVHWEVSVWPNNNRLPLVK